MHGGAQASFADDITTYAIAAADPEGRYGSTIDMSITFLKAAPLGAKVSIQARCLKLGRTLAFRRVHVLRFSDKGSALYLTDKQNLRLREANSEQARRNSVYTA